MKELHDIVTNKIGNMVENGTIEQLIENKLESLLAETVNDAMKSYSSFGKALKESIEKSIGTSLSQVSFPEYNHFVSQLVVEKYSEVLSKEAANNIDVLLKDELKPVPDVIDAQALLDETKEYWEESAHSEGEEEIDIKWDESDSAIYMTLKHPEYESNNIKISFYNHGEESGVYHIGYINKDDRPITSGIGHATHAMGLAGYFYKLYCKQTKIHGLSNIYDEAIYVGFD
ncbi:hypothetical protein [Shewanella surugensis]|uniref:Uncharacterized protein n=1 Tax=Shewanella surugensis TaxID=212020 RepID=A0ABT0L914_9GAMM|nr:hypothetical protein [Shewanella surugensis]MCL1124203.1 hypothetical protein [Shewanella surugensis]